MLLTNEIDNIEEINKLKEITFFLLKDTKLNTKAKNCLFGCVLVLEGGRSDIASKHSEVTKSAINQRMRLKSKETTLFYKKVKFVYDLIENVFKPFKDDKIS